MVWFIILMIAGCSKKQKLPDVIVFSHAGTSLYEERTFFPPNSLESIQHSIEFLDVDGVEVDIQLTRDSVLVLYHDLYIQTSANYSGCIGDYNWSDLKELNLNYSKYKIVKLKTALDYLLVRKKYAYLDFKLWNPCLGHDVVKPTVVAMNKLLEQYSESDKEYIIAGSWTVEFLNGLNIGNRAVSIDNINAGVDILKENDFNYILLQNITDFSSLNELIDQNVTWGLFGGKSNHEIRSTISHEPDFIITDNPAFTKKITE